MDLYYRDTSLGTLSRIEGEWPWMSGEIKLSPSATDFLPFFEYMTDESKGMEEPPFAESLLDPENWSVEEDEQRRGIEVPAVHSDRTIEWRWR